MSFVIQNDSLVFSLSIQENQGAGLAGVPLELSLFTPGSANLNQLWEFYPEPNGYYFLQSVLPTADGQSIVIENAWGSLVSDIRATPAADGQLWQFAQAAIDSELAFIQSKLGGPIWVISIEVSHSPPASSPQMAEKSAQTDAYGRSLQRWSFKLQDGSQDKSVPMIPAQIPIAPAQKPGLRIPIGEGGGGTGSHPGGPGDKGPGK